MLKGFILGAASGLLVAAVWAAALSVAAPPPVAATSRGTGSNDFPTANAFPRDGASAARRGAAPSEVADSDAIAPTAQAPEAAPVRAGVAPRGEDPNGLVSPRSVGPEYEAVEGGSVVHARAEGAPPGSPDAVDAETAASGERNATLSAPEAGNDAPGVVPFLDIGGGAAAPEGRETIQLRASTRDDSADFRGVAEVDSISAAPGAFDAPSKAGGSTVPRPAFDRGEFPAPRIGSPSNGARDAAE